MDGKIRVREEWESKKYWELLLLTVLILLVLSTSTHKEPRFLLVVTPLLLLLSIKGFQKLNENKILLIFVVTVNIFLFATLTFSSKTGGTQILRDLRHEIDRFPA
jgi:hypothetical protein